MDFFARRRNDSVFAEPFSIRRKDDEAGPRTDASWAAVRIEEVLLRCRAGEPSRRAGCIVAASSRVAGYVRDGLPVPRWRRGYRRLKGASVCSPGTARHRAQQRRSADARIEDLNRTPPFPACGVTL